MKTKLSVADIAVCIAVLAVAAVLILYPSLGNHSDTVYVRTSSGSFTYPLSEDRTEVIHSEGYTLTLRIKDGLVCISESSCEDGLCVAAGMTDDPSRPIVCAPARVLVRVGDIKYAGGEKDADCILGR